MEANENQSDRLSKINPDGAGKDEKPSNASNANPATGAEFVEESKKLKLSWERHSAEFLKSYLTRTVQDPRINPQSILCRHFITDFIFDADFKELKLYELLFSATAQWIFSHLDEISDGYFRKALICALEQNADNFEGLPLPQFVRLCYQAEPAPVFGDIVIPNFLKLLLTDCDNGFPPDSALNAFVEIWEKTVSTIPVSKVRKAKVLEAACGSANDFRAIRSIGLDKFIEYSGFDISEKNISNAKTMFPDARFFTADIYTFDAKPMDYNLIFVHDLFEHLSPGGIEYALKKLSSICSDWIYIGFFNMDEIPEHIIVPYEDYYWNRLSAGKICEVLNREGFEPTIIHINTLFNELFRAGNLYNPYGYSIIGRRYRR